MNAPSSRPLSPHLSIYRWQPHMLVSILHRMTGAGLTTVGLGVLAWWLVALASGAGAYATFEGVMGSLLGQLVLVGLTWAFFQHLFSGLRHLVLDMGAGYELKVNRFWAIMTIAASVFATALVWAIFKGVF
ncbi:succinate dehydrogenase, cytochrome b556 subunit [Sphingomicrobium aestuariivivum]|uniref:succinate dehydrogenase, cytochrome b556 subunit n=1 Tax=Sphingomicrobium aestuariivivum TaxID=1582356 RepID=UPI001FD644A9|nr:succinate dehydrogenase, cytochrome b556 subunit [Sphingomicrobium aestuariivivum]MCJ8190820.1 succinate dehydrogenase, cytochrome b556 subunit [Sphingomicrobium aestuariivivum]